MVVRIMSVEEKISSVQEQLLELQSVMEWLKQL